MLKRLGTQIFIVIILIYLVIMPTYAQQESIDWNEEETQWLNSHAGKTLVLGLDPYTGMDYFEENGKIDGYLIPFVSQLEKELGVKIIINDKLSWSEVLNGLQNGNVDIIFGANENEQRRITMSFTKPLYQNPYSVYGLESGKVDDIGDLDHKRVGFLEGDLIGEVFSSIYKNIRIEPVRYPNQMEGLKAVLKGDVSAFITANGGITKEIVYNFPEIKSIADVRTFTSDMTLSTRKSDRILSQMIDKVITEKNTEISHYILAAERAYNRKILKFSPEERQWLSEKPTIIVGSATDYLPFDYYQGGKYRGIAGDYLTASLDEVGVSIKVVSAPFDELYTMIEKGQIDVLNMAKTEEREKEFDFTNAFLEERDEIYGRRRVPYVQDIYALEGKRVAVVKGYWHKDYLEKNLSKIDIVMTADLKESLSAVANGKADYFIENPTVAQYYIDGLGYTNIIPKGKTSQDSYLYFGVSRSKPYLVDIINRSMSLVQYEKVKSQAMMSVPVQKNITAGKLINILLMLGLVVAALTLFLLRLFRELIEQRSQRKMLEERQKLIYKDGLTGLYNRMYFNDLERLLESRTFPQYFIMADLNGLKFVNDTYGHSVGDEYILSFKEALKEVFSDSIVIRMGGDEFLTIVFGAKIYEIETRLLALAEACEKRQFYTETGELITPQAARGWGVRENEKTSIDEAVMAADQMMYSHKATFKKRRTD